MAITNALIDAALTPQTVFLADREQAITTIIFCNSSSDTDANITVHMVPVGSPISSATKIMNNVLLPATETFALDTERFILTTGDSIQVVSDQAGVVACTVSSMTTQ